MSQDKITFPALSILGVRAGIFPTVREGNSSTHLPLTLSDNPMFDTILTKDYRRETKMDSLRLVEKLLIHCGYKRQESVSSLVTALQRGGFTQEEVTILLIAIADKARDSCMQKPIYQRKNVIVEPSVKIMEKQASF